MDIACEARRVGIFGGAFDPPHHGHLAVAQAAIAQLGLDELRIIPTGDAWHKERTLSTGTHRLKMAELAFGGLARVVVDDREFQRSGPSYTIDTLDALHQEHPGSQLYLVIGGDQLAAFRHWHRWQDILARATLCVADRPQPATPQANLATQVRDLPPHTRLQLPPMPVSATAIRQQINAYCGAEGALKTESQNDTSPGLEGLVPEAVARYISIHGLYQAR